MLCGVPGVRLTGSCCCCTGDGVFRLSLVAGVTVGKVKLCRLLFVSPMENIT